MPELIDRQAVRLLESDADAYTGNWNDDYEKGFCDAINKVLELPTIEPEVRHGRWETINPLYSNVYCSECGAAADKHLAKRYKGCPFCLCVMDAADTNGGGKGGDDK